MVSSEGLYRLDVGTLSNVLPDLVSGSDEITWAFPAVAAIWGVLIVNVWPSLISAGGRLWIGKRCVNVSCVFSSCSDLISKRLSNFVASRWRRLASKAASARWAAVGG